MKPEIKVIKNDGLAKFSHIRIREPSISDLVQAVNMAGKNYAQIAPALLSIITTFDGKMLPLEEIQSLPFSFSLEILSELLTALEIDLTKFTDRLLNSLKLQALDTKK